MADTVVDMTSLYSHEIYTLRILKEWGTGQIDTTTTARFPYNTAPYNTTPVSPWVSDTSGASYTITSWTDLMNQLETAHGDSIVSASNINNKVDNTSAETIAGVKTFSNSPIVPTPSGSTDVANKGYVDSFTPATATTTTEGIVELATSAETITGTDTGRVVTPAGLQAKVASDTALGLTEYATTAETIAGTDDTRAVTPAGLKGSFTPDYCYLRKTANQTSGTSVLWDDEISDTSGMHDGVSNTERITIMNDGRYDIKFYGIRIAASTGDFCFLYKNGTITGIGDMVESGSITAGDYTFFQFTTTLNLVAGDYLEIQYVSSFTGTYDFKAAYLNRYSEIIVNRVPG